ncbi:MAG: DUF4388 domain-containing protein [Candidatus Obscuribacterales bacterium]|jgi:hypothetical protein|nr:DUF4388 domain-containing protein [Candidatus Obscuribacterales bacterium]
MYRPKGPSPQQPAIHRMPKQQAMPSLDDLEFVILEGSKRPNTLVELPWGSESSQSYLLTLMGGAEPIWSLFIGSDSRGEPLWRHSTRDLALIHSLVFQSVPDDHVSGFGVSAQASAGSAADTGPGGFAFDGNANASLQGRIENMQMATLLQSIQMSKMTGRLQITDQCISAQIFFKDGMPVHANTIESIGDQAFVEMMTWEKGDFHFFPNEATAEQTIQRRMETVILEGISLLDQLKYLDSQGLKLESSYLVRTEARISQEQFKAKLANGAPIDLGAQMSFYEQIDNRSRLLDILCRRPLNKVEWAPILFNLISCGLVALSDVSPLAGKAAGLTPVEIDPAVTVGILRSLVRSDTGMFTYPAFLFLLEQEFAKSVVMGLPLTLVVFEIRLATGDSIQPLPIPALREAANRLAALKRPFDVLGHYETFDMALFLPGSSLKIARTIANKAASALLNAPLIEGNPARLLLAGGIAACPEDTQDLGRLIAAAKEAKNKAKASGQPIKLFSEL